MRHLVYLLLLFLPAAIAAGMPPCATAWAAGPGLAERMVERINEIRRAHNAAPVREDPKLTRAAQEHAEDMARHEFLGHRGSDGSRLEDRVKRAGFDYRIVAENVAGGLASPEETVDAWMESPGHRRNILDVQVCRVGIGHVYVPDDSGKVTYGHYWTAVLARPPGPFCPLN